MNTTQEIKVKDMGQEIDAWHRYIYFERESKSYELVLYWDQFSGYEIMWGREDDTRISKAPEWANDWDEDDHNGMTLEHYLDDLTYEWKGN